MTKKHVVLIVGLVLIAAIALINGLLFRVKTVTVDFDTETSIQAEEGEAEKIIAASGIKKGKKRFARRQKPLFPHNTRTNQRLSLMIRPCA